MRVLVTAASKYGATGEIILAIADVLSERGFHTSVAPPDEVGTLDGYDAVGAEARCIPVTAGSGEGAGPLPGHDLAAWPVWLFSSGLVGDLCKPEEGPVHVAENPRGHEGVGALGSGARS